MKNIIKFIIIAIVGYTILKFLNIIIFLEIHLLYISVVFILLVLFIYKHYKYHKLPSL